MNVYKIVDGTILCAAVALVADVVLKGIEKLVTKGCRDRDRRLRVRRV